MDLSHPLRRLSNRLFLKSRVYCAVMRLAIVPAGLLAMALEIGGIPSKLTGVGGLNLCCLDLKVKPEPQRSG